MRAILLAAGYGIRLRPITDNIPKCLVPIKGVPLLEIWLEQLTLAGVESFLINTHYLSEQVDEYIRSSPFRDKVTLVYEPELLGTAGTLLKNQDFFQGEDGLFIHADNYCFPSFSEFITAHKNRPIEALITMMTFRTDNPSSCGIVELDDQGMLLGFYEKINSPPGNLANAAIYIISREFFPFINTRFSLVTDFSNEILPELLGKVMTYETTNKFIDIGTLVTYQQANQK